MVKQSARRTRRRSRPKWLWPPCVKTRPWPRTGQAVRTTPQ